MGKKILSLMIVVMLVVPPALASSPVHEFQLDNGLKILVREDHRAPVIVSQIWYKVGSSYEPRGKTGISHVLEHMMFKGTPAIGPGEFARIIAANGGKQNAFTSRDYTAYFQTMQKDRLAVSFRLEADRMRGLLLNEDEIAKELQVVAEERRLRTEDSPEGLTYEQFYATSYMTSPYRNPIIGWMSDIKSLTAADLRDWYRQWYAPNNAILVVVGDVDAKSVFKLAETHFGAVPSQEINAPTPQPEIPQRGVRRITVKVPAKLPQVMLGYKVPVLKTAQHEEEVYALQVLAGVLNAGKSARLSRNLVRGKQVAAWAQASYSMTSRLDELFVLAANPTPGHTPAEIEQALRNEIQQLREEIVTAPELARVVAQVVASEVYERDSMFYQGMRMGALEAVGLGWNTLEDYVERIQSVTPEQIRDVARKYLIDDHLTVAILEPVPTKDAQLKASSSSIPLRQNTHTLGSAK